MKRFVYIVLLIGVVLGFRFYQKYEASGKMKAEVMQQMESSLPSGLDMVYVKSLVDHAHPQAMDDAYKMGGRHQSSTFDAVVYRNALHQHMSNKAMQDGKPRYAALFR